MASILAPESRQQACGAQNNFTANCAKTLLPSGIPESIGEIAWNEGPPFGDFQSLLGNTEATGGGFSIVYLQPSYQQAAVRSKGRGVPDVAYNAAIFHGVLTYLNIPGITPGFYLFGGTSCGSPQWAAITAIADR